MTGSRVGRATCSEHECQGIRLSSGSKCLAHAASQDLDVELKRLSQEGAINARGVRISAELLRRILDAAPPDEERPNRPGLIRAKFDDATFGDGASFEGATFGRVLFKAATFGDGAAFAGAIFDGDVSFAGTAFGSYASFEDATFDGGALFHEATFGNDASFEGATFGNDAFFGAATFRNYASFQGATFGVVSFKAATFGEGVSFDEATFGNDAMFIGATFGDASFEDATFGNTAMFERVRFDGSVSFDDVKIGDWIRLGPIVAKELTLRRATFGRSPDLIISADRVRCQQAKFPDGVRLRVRWAEIALDNTDFGRPSVLAAAPTSEEFTEIGEPEVIETPLTGTQPHRTAHPRPICLAGCDVHNLLLVDCDLRACRFAGAHNLAALRLEGSITLPSTPPGWQTAWTLPPLWRWGRRQTIAEEHYWRQLQLRLQGWRGALPPSPSPYVASWHDRGERGDPSNPYGPAEIAGVYRALRKGREDNKDEPGAADFYYGEMEMRRHDRAKPRAERLVLFLYWLTSGYALRASRALAWLACILVLSTVLLATYGLEQPATVSAVQATITGSPPNQTIRFQAPTTAR